MSDDITFCGSECNNKKCFRHPSNIAEPNIHHSFAYLKDTDMCPMKKQEIRLIDADSLKEKAWITQQCNGCEIEDIAVVCVGAIDNAPTVVNKNLTPERPQVVGISDRLQGEWVGNAFDEHYCKRCGHPALWEEEPDGYYEVQSNFCPNCGADMRGDK